MVHEYELTLPVLKVLNKSLLGELTTTELREEVKQKVHLDSDDLMPIRNRPDFRIDQTIRNIKSHKDHPGNPFFEGYLEDIPRGFRITEKGRKFLTGIA